jgi:hypothetical protein
VFDGLRGSEQPGVERGRALIFFGDFIAFLGDAVNRGALLALWLFVEQGENPFEPFNMAFGLAAMLFKGSGEFFGIRRLLHLRQRRQNFLFRVVDIFQRIEKQLVELFWFFFGHGAHSV